MWNLHLSIQKWSRPHPLNLYISSSYGLLLEIICQVVDGGRYSGTSSIPLDVHVIQMKLVTNQISLVGSALYFGAVWKRNCFWSGLEVEDVRDFVPPGRKRKETVVKQKTLCWLQVSCIYPCLISEILWWVYKQWHYRFYCPGKRREI